MPSKRRRRRSKARFLRSVRPEVWVWLLVFANIGAGMAYSPLTAVRKVRVVGALDGHGPRVTKELQALTDVPVMRLNGAWVESRLLTDPEVETAAFRPNLFGRAVVHLTARSAVGRVGKTDAYLDPAGRVFRSRRDFGGVPVVVLPRGATSPSLALLGGWESGSTARLCAGLSAQVPNVEWTVAVSERGVLSLQVESGAEVILGSSESLPQKIEKLKSLLGAKPDLLKRVRQLNLTSPEAPMVVRG